MGFVEAVGADPRGERGGEGEGRDVGFAERIQVAPLGEGGAFVGGEEHGGHADCGEGDVGAWRRGG